MNSTLGKQSMSTSKYKIELTNKKLKEMLTF